MGCLMIAFAISGLYQAKLRLSWPTVPGRMERSQVVRSQNARSGYKFFPDISYTYYLRGHTYMGDRLSMDKPGEDRQEVLEQRLARYPASATVTVHYDPSSPELSVLEVGGLDWDDYGLLVIGLLTVAGSIFVYRITASNKEPE